MTDAKKSPRNPNIEVFRVFTMFAIVLFHSFSHGIFNTPGKIPLWSIFFTSALIWHVDAFIAISGWFGIKTTLDKFLRLYGLVAFKILVCAIFLTVHTGRFDVNFLKPYPDWFTPTYFALMLLAPFINFAVDQLKEAGRRKLVCMGIYAMACGILLSAPVSTTLRIATGISSHSLGQFVLVYVLARMARHYWSAPIRRERILSVLAMCILVSGGMILATSAFRRTFTPGIHVYHLPHIYIFAIALLMLFYWHLRFPAWLGKACTFLGPSMFGVYLIHETTPFGRSLYRIPQAWMAEHTLLHPALIVAISAILTFAVALSIDLARRFALSTIKHMIGK